MPAAVGEGTAAVTAPKARIAAVIQGTDAKQEGKGPARPKSPNRKGAYTPSSATRNSPLSPLRGLDQYQRAGSRDASCSR